MILSLFWSGLTGRGVVAGMVTGFFSVPLFKFVVSNLPGIGEFFCGTQRAAPFFRFGLRRRGGDEFAGQKRARNLPASRGRASRRSSVKIGRKPLQNPLETAKTGLERINSLGALVFPPKKPVKTANLLFLFAFL